MKTQLSRTKRGAFCLTELLIVLGLISILISLLLPVIRKVRAAANSTACLSNVRQMGMAWMTYISDNKGRVPDYMWNSPGKGPDVAWQGYWLGVLDTYKVKGPSLLCPAANEAPPVDSKSTGYGNVKYAWTGKAASGGTIVHYTKNTYREGSYGYNRYLTTELGNSSRIYGTKNLCDIPAFFDCVYIDAKPPNGTIAFPVLTPPDLRGDLSLKDPEHWKFLLSRHGRGISVAMADGSARWVALEETYMLTWFPGWTRYTLKLPVQ